MPNSFAIIKNCTAKLAPVLIISSGFSFSKIINAWYKT